MADTMRRRRGGLSKALNADFSKTGNGINKDVTFEGNKLGGDETVCITLNAANLVLCPDSILGYRAFSFALAFSTLKCH